jgi:hypothetical protein
MPFGEIKSSKHTSRSTAPRKAATNAEKVRETRAK